MNRTQNFAVCLAGMWMLGCLAIPQSLPAQSIQPQREGIQETKSNQTPAIPSTDVNRDGSVRPIDQAMLDEINRIRQQLGGGIAEQLGDLNLKESSPPLPNSASQSGSVTVESLNADFEQELSRLVSGQDGKTQVPESKIPNSNGVTATLPMLPGYPKVPVQQVLPRNRPPVLRSPQHLEASVSQLRNSARQLDQIAAGLEDVHLYDEADKIRQQARDFWLRARQIDGEMR